MAEIVPPFDDDRPSGVSRRTVLTGVAWSVPVIAIAVASPARALSGPPPVDPADIDLVNHLIANQHGFLITNTSTEAVTVLVSFTASVTAPNSEAEGVLRDVTDDASADFYSEIATLGATATENTDTYRHVWTEPITLTPVSPEESTATREGTMLFTLPPGASFRFWQNRPWSVLLPSPTVRATVTSIATGTGPLIPATGGASTSFTL